MGSTTDQPWHRAKAEINSKLRDLTELWYVGSDKRDDANDLGIHRWDEKDYRAQDLGVRGAKTGAVLQKIIDIKVTDFSENHTNTRIIFPKIVNNRFKFIHNPYKIFFRYTRSKYKVCLKINFN